MKNFLKTKFRLSLITFLLINTLAFSQTLVSPDNYQLCVDIPMAVRDSSTAANGVYDLNARWVNGSSIKIKFMGGSEFVQTKVKYYSKMWEKYANVKFDYVTSGTPDILIGFNQDGTSWSHVGTDCRILAAKGKPSMNFGWFNDKTSDVVFQETTLHEFGHVLGLLHEHQNPYGNIQWNMPVVRNYYTNIGWPLKQIDEQIFNKYSVTLSNHIYDPKSIMHYHIPKEFTLNGFEVPWNSELSAGDIALIKELYPFSATTVVVNPVNPTPTAATTCTLENIEVKHNMYKDDVYGMSISNSFTIKNALGKQCHLVAYFYYADGQPLKDLNNKFCTTAGGVAVSNDFTPTYASSKYTNVQLFLPYDELHVGDGKSQLKFIVAIWDDKKNELIQSGAYYFDYSKGIVCNNLSILSTFENDNERLVVMPQFTIENAKGNACRACVYFYLQDGTKISSSSNFCQQFIPAYSTTSFNYGYYSDLYLYIPYASLDLPEGTHNVKYFVALFDENNKQFATSNWETFTITK